MQYPRMPLSEEFSIPKSHKKKQSAPKTCISQLQAKKVKIQEMQAIQPLLLKESRKSSKRNLKTEVPPVYQHSEISNSDSLPDSSSSGNKYRALRRKYLLLEEESFSLGGELREVEDEVKTLEDEKFALLDKLLVLEGLISPAEMQSHGPQSRLS